MGFILLVLFYLLCPVLIIYLSERYSLVKKIGPVVLCYTIGLIIGNMGILPHYDPNIQELLTDQALQDNEAEKLLYSIQDTLLSGTILLAIPLLLFSLDVRSWLKMAGRTFLSLILGLVSVVLMVIMGYFIFRNILPDAWKIGGLLIGVYSGGTPNIAVLRLALDVDPNTYIVTHTYDLVIGAIVLLFILTVAQRFFLLFMRPFKMSDLEMFKGSITSYEQEYGTYKGIFKRNIFLPVLAAIFIAIITVGISSLISMGLISVFAQDVTEDKKSIILMTAMILSITTLGIIVSLIKQVNKIRMSFQTGMYLILVFCIVVSSMADIRSFSLESWPILVYIVIGVIGSLLVHALLSRIFNIDVDNFLIISVALSMSPPFVPVVAGALRNKYIIIPGLVIGIIGYAIGTYLGVLIAFILELIK